MTKAGRTSLEMYPLVESYLQGHATQKAFCAEHGLSTSVLNYWLVKYRRQTTPTPAHQHGAFLEIRPRIESSEQALLEVAYPHGVRLRLFAPIEPAYLERLLALMPGARPA